MPDDDEAPPAVPEWEPSELAKRIAQGHARSSHFEHVLVDELAGMIQHVTTEGRAKRYRHRTLYWDAGVGIAVLVNPRDEDGGTAFPSGEAYFAEWGYPEEAAR